MLGKDSSHSFGMTMRVISNEVRDPSLIPFSKESTKDTKVSDISASPCRGLRGEFRKGRHRGLPPKAVKREFFSSFGRFALKTSLLRALRGEQNKLNVTHVPHESLKYQLFFRFS